MNSRCRLRRIIHERQTSSTTLQDTSIVQQWNVQCTCIQQWQHLQVLYMPGLAQYQRDTSDSPSPDNPSSYPEDWDLLLPSSIPTMKRQICIEGLPQIEERLQTAQCHDALESIRHILRIKARMVIFKNKNVRGQYSGTCSHAVIDHVHEHARSYANKYRAARKAILKLSGHRDWENKLWPLLNSDICCYTDPD